MVLEEAMSDAMGRHIPLAVIVALVLQAATAVWWAATKDSDDRFQTQRVNSLTQDVAQARDGQTQMIERLARIEERVNDELFMLSQLDKRLGTLQAEAARK